MSEENNNRFANVLGLFGVKPEQAKAHVDAKDAEAVVRIYAAFRWKLKIRQVSPEDLDAMITECMTEVEKEVKNPKTRQEVLNQFLLMRNRAAEFLGVQPESPTDEAA